MRAFRTLSMLRRRPLSVTPSLPRAGKAAARRSALHMTVGLAACLTAGLGSGCIVPDPEYCTGDDQCGTQSGAEARKVCHPTRHLCMEVTPGSCFKDDDCPLATPRCDRVTSQCSACLPDGTDMSCLRVSASARCTAVSGGDARCVECGTNLDCPKERPICDSSTSQCRACAQHSDCEGELYCDTGQKCTDSLVCIKDGDLPEGRAGHCAANYGMSARVVYVKYLDNSTDCMTKDVPANGFSPTTPVCTLSYGLKQARAMNIRYIRLLGDSIDVATEVFTDGPFYIIGAPRKGSTKNVVMNARGLAIDVSYKGNVTLDQVDVLELLPGQGPIQCLTNIVPANASWLRIYGSTIGGMTRPGDFPSPYNPGIIVTLCNLIIDRCVIGVSKKSSLTDPQAGAHAFGIQIRDFVSGTAPARTLTIQNSIFAGNLITGLLFDDIDNTGTKALIQYNTIVGNGRQSSSMGGALVCPFKGSAAPAKRFLNNLIIDNQLSSGSQFSRAEECTFFNNVVGTKDMTPAAIMGIKHLDADLDENLRLISSDKNRQSCIDQGAAAADEAQPAYDLDGNVRPKIKGGKLDIGATEVN